MLCCLILLACPTFSNRQTRFTSNGADAKQPPLKILGHFKNAILGKKNAILRNMKSKAVEAIAAHVLVSTHKFCIFKLLLGRFYPGKPRIEPSSCTEPEKLAMHNYYE